jgi:hypothetical protein
MELEDSILKESQGGGDLFGYCFYHLRLLIQLFSRDFPTLLSCSDYVLYLVTVNYLPNCY